MAELLLELFSEEIPARMQARAGADLQRLVTDGLVEAGLTYGAAANFVTPRRLCLVISDLTEASPTLSEERKGPRVDAPDKAIEGFLRGAGLSRDQLEVRDDKKGQVYFAKITKDGRPASDIIAEVVPDVIRNFPWPKSMRWGAGSLRWVRPLHSILCVLSTPDSSEVVPFDVDGIEAAHMTAGHRFHAPEWFSVTNFEDYRAGLTQSHVVLDAADRQAQIWSDATNAAFAQGLEVVEDKGLLAEVAGLVEWPVVLMGEIGADFLDLPPEVLQTSMKEHQKFFSVRNPKTERIEKFITVANRETADTGATILAGNQKVLSARLSDAKFFWENDLRVPLADMAAKLSNVTFHNKLGTEADRIARLEVLAGTITFQVGETAQPDLAKQAATLCKADLSSEMVYEFPELQGVMGRYYALAAGLPTEVADAARDHYAPLGPSDTVPSAPISITVALADKIDKIGAFWSIEERPTGSKDPFALRRAALGIIRLVLENEVRLSLLTHLETSVMHALSQQGYDFDAEDAPKDAQSNLAAVKLIAGDALRFVHDRLKVYLRDRGITHDVIDACLNMPRNDDMTLLVRRAEALRAFLATDDGTNLIQGYKRARNILAQAEAKDGVEYSFGADPKFAEDATETALFDALKAADAAIAPAMAAEDFAAAMSAMAALRAPIDAFFEAVQVNADNDILRRNRLNLLGQIRKTMGQVADFAQIEG